MNLESAVLYFVYVLIGIWSVSFIYNIIYFFITKSEQLDKACYNKSRSFKESFEDLDELERIKKKRFNEARNKIEFYEKNALLTRRKYFYYADRIEEGFIRLYLGKFLSKRDVFNKLDPAVRFHFTYLLTFCALVLVLLILLFILIAIDHFNFLLVLTGSTLILFYVYFFIHIISVNCALFYGLINLFLYIAGVDRSRLFKNTSILNFLTSKWKGFNTEGMVIGAAAVGSFHSYSGTGFGGFGGGSFGGGGAGGSW